MNRVREKNKNYIGRDFYIISDYEKSKFKIRRYFSSPWAKILHRDMIGEARFDVKLAKGEDALFMAAISNKILGVRKTTDDCQYIVRRRLGSVTRSKVDRHKEILRILYLLGRYFQLLADSRYDKMFITSRIIATVFQLRYLFGYNRVQR